MSSASENGVTTRQRQPLKLPLRTMREIRVTQDMTLRDLETATGLSRGLLSQIERGRMWPSSTEVEAIASALGVPLEVRVQLVHEDGAA